MRKLPEISFDTALYVPVATDNWGKFTLNKGKHPYSASPGVAEQDIWLRISAEFVEVMDAEHHPIVTHRRLYGGENECLESMEWLPYLKYIARKPRSLRNSGIYGMMPESIQKYLDSCQNSDRGKILKGIKERLFRSVYD